jgi:hypothetical protein
MKLVIPMPVSEMLGRDLNRKRCAIKQEINKIFADCWGEAKHNYGSV